MKRRTFLKVSAAGTTSMVVPSFMLPGFINTSIKGLKLEGNIEIKVNPQKAIISNGKVRKVISYLDQRPSSIRVSSLYDKTMSKELLADNRQSWFEFVINNKMIKSSHSLWQYHDHSIRKLQNDGQELQLMFKGAEKGVKGLQVSIKQQVFPHSTLMREKLRLSASAHKVFYINKQKKKLHFLFPRYDLKAYTKSFLTSTEFQIATWDKEILDSDCIGSSSYYSRKWDETGDHNLAMNHMFHPAIKPHEIYVGSEKTIKGPITISSLIEGEAHFLMSYEHASQDNLADFDFDKTDGYRPPLKFLGIHHSRTPTSLSLSVDMLRGGYLDGQRISNQKPYESVWTANGFYHGKGLAQGKQMIFMYLLKWICENSVSRKPAFYYNTWAMERDEASKDENLRNVMTTNRILKEIQYADQLGVDLFVLDDGWEENQGVWNPNQERLHEGLHPIYEALQKRDIQMGLWMSPLGIAEGTQRYRHHQEWLIRHENDKPVLGQWDDPVFCLVSDFYDQFIKDCKDLIDRGVRYFKWDALNTFSCTSPHHHHGGREHSKKERADNYGYLFPIYVKKAMAALTAYEPDLIIEIDLTENRRAMPGLAPLSRGKLFWMNNGASWYGDYSSYRAKAMRTVPNEFAGWFPLDLFTFANYPQNRFPYFQQRGNINSSLIAGRGFWGNLSKMNEKQRRRVGKLVAKSKKVLPAICNTMTDVSGRIGASPELYERVNLEQATGQIIAFSGSALNYNYKIKLNKNNLLAVVNNSYEIKKNYLVIHFQFPMADASREAFLYSNQGSDIRIVQSTAWLKRVQLEDSQLSYILGAKGRQNIIWPKELGKPNIFSAKKINIKLVEKNANYEITIISHTAEQKVTLY